MRKNNILTQRSTYSYWLTENIRWSDTDLVGHVNNLSFSTYYETGRTQFLRPFVARGVEQRVLLLLAQMNVSFLGEAHWPGEVDIGTGMLEVGRSSCRMGQGLFLGDQCISTAESVMVMIDETTRKPKEIPDWVREYLLKYGIHKAE